MAGRLFKLLRLVAVPLVLVLVVVAVAWWQPIMVHLSQETGTSSGASRAYDFWSGFGSDIGEATLVAGIVAALRHRNCHAKGCLRLGHPVAGTPYVACHKHHPAHTPPTRNVSAEHIENAYREAS